MEFHHVSILLEPCLEALQIKPDGVYVDATTGGAGHSLRIAERLHDTGRLICIDRDDEALENAKDRLKDVWQRVTPVKSDFRDIDKVLEGQGLAGADGILFDLGVSSPQLDHAERGFSYMQDAPLDMRMSQQGPTAADLVNTLDREELTRILRDYGEEPYAWQIAGKIVAARAEQPILTTLQLAEIVAAAVPPAERRKAKNPARRTFQAIRIAVNSELDALNEGLDAIFDCLAPGGRLCVITFHSLEDRIVKAAFQQAAQGCTCPKDFPVCICGKKPKVRLTPRKPILPDEREIEENPRARSAKLRVCEKI